MYILVWVGFTFAFGKFLHTTGITEYLYNLLTSRAAIRIIPNTYAPHSYFIAMFPSQFLASYFIGKFANIFPSVDLRIGKKRERRHQRLTSFIKWLAGTFAVSAFPYFLGLLLTKLTPAA